MTVWVPTIAHRFIPGHAWLLGAVAALLIVRRPSSVLVDLLVLEE